MAGMRRTRDPSWQPTGVIRPVAAGVAGLLVLLGAATGCETSRDDTMRGFPGAAAADGPEVFEPGTVPAAATPYVDALAANFVDGARLAARVDDTAAPCVAQRWVATLDPVALGGAGVAPEDLRDITLEEIRAAVPASLDEPRARALVAAFDACGVRYDGAVLDSLQVTGQVDPVERSCIAAALPDDLLASITLSILIQPQLDPALSREYGAAVGPCLD